DARGLAGAPALIFRRFVRPVDAEDQGRYVERRSSARIAGANRGKRIPGHGGAQALPGFPKMPWWPGAGASPRRSTPLVAYPGEAYVKVETVADGSKQILIGGGECRVQRHVAVIPGPAGISHLVVVHIASPSSSVLSWGGVRPGRCVSIGPAVPGA